jgi:hypothetical protein
MEILIARLTRIPTLPILISFYIIALGIGIFMIIKPALILEMQRRFYAKINWKIEFISMPKEIRNTRLMGWLLIIFLIVTSVFILSHKAIFL